MKINKGRTLDVLDPDRCTVHPGVLFLLGDVLPREPLAQTVRVIASSVSAGVDLPRSRVDDCTGAPRCQ